MTVLKSKRRESKFEVISHAYKLRDNITDLLLCDFHYKFKESPNETEIQKQRRMAREQWFIKDERDYIISILRSMMYNIFQANKTPTTTLEECLERRKHQNKAIGDCSVLMQELQYTIKTLPVNINKYTRFADEISREEMLLKAWRKSDNKYHKALNENK